MKNRFLFTCVADPNSETCEPALVVVSKRASRRQSRMRAKCAARILGIAPVVMWSFHAAALVLLDNLPVHVEVLK